MQPKAHGVVQHVIDGLRAMGSINSQRVVAKGRSADLTTAPTCTAEEPIRKARHRQQTGCRSSPAGRAECRAARGRLHSVRATAPEPLGSSARPPEVWRARGRSRPENAALLLCCVPGPTVDKVRHPHHCRHHRPSTASPLTMDTSPPCALPCPD